MTLIDLTRTYRAVRTLTLALLLTATATVGHTQTGGAFTSYAGNWSGTGSITIAGGNDGKGGTERIRCRGMYTVSGGGNSLHQTLRCASDSYRFDLTSDVTANGNSISGRWGEESRGVNGTLQGQISGGDVTALVETNAFAATFNMTSTGNRQTVAIASKGDIRAVNISLTRSN
jgi:hypothetical protein